MNEKKSMKFYFIISVALSTMFFFTFLGCQPEVAKAKEADKDLGDKIPTVSVDLKLVNKLKSYMTQAKGIDQTVSLSFDNGGRACSRAVYDNKDYESPDSHVSSNFSETVKGFREGELMQSLNAINSYIGTHIIQPDIITDLPEIQLLNRKIAPSKFTWSMEADETQRSYLTRKSADTRAFLGGFVENFMDFTESERGEYIDKYDELSHDEKAMIIVAYSGLTAPQKSIIDAKITSIINLWDTVSLENAVIRIISEITPANKTALFDKLKTLTLSDLDESQRFLLFKLYDTFDDDIKTKINEYVDSVITSFIGGTDIDFNELKKLWDYMTESAQTALLTAIETKVSGFSELSDEVGLFVCRFFSMMSDDKKNDLINKFGEMDDSQRAEIMIVYDSLTDKQKNLIYSHIDKLTTAQRELIINALDLIVIDRLTGDITFKIYWSRDIDCKTYFEIKRKELSPDDIKWSFYIRNEVGTEQKEYYQWNGETNAVIYYLTSAISESYLFYEPLNDDDETVRACMGGKTLDFASLTTGYFNKNGGVFVEGWDENQTLYTFDESGKLLRSIDGHPHADKLMGAYIYNINLGTDRFYNFKDFSGYEAVAPDDFMITEVIYGYNGSTEYGSRNNFISFDNGVSYQEILSSNRLYDVLGQPSANLVWAKNDLIIHEESGFRYWKPWTEGDIIYDIDYSSSINLISGKNLADITKEDLYQRGDGYTVTNNTELNGDYKVDGFIVLDGNDYIGWKEYVKLYSDEAALLADDDFYFGDIGEGDIINKIKVNTKVFRKKVVLDTISLMGETYYTTRGMTVPAKDLVFDVTAFADYYNPITSALPSFIRQDTDVSAGAGYWIKANELFFDINADQLFNYNLYQTGVIETRLPVSEGEVVWSPSIKGLSINEGKTELSEDLLSAYRTVAEQYFIDFDVSKIAIATNPYITVPEAAKFPK